MENDEIISAAEIAEFSRLMQGARLSMAYALLEECRLLRRRLEHEQSEIPLDLSGFTWVDSDGGQQQAPADTPAALLAELLGMLEGLSRMDRVLRQLGAMQRHKQIACRHKN